MQDFSSTLTTKSGAYITLATRPTQNGYDIDHIAVVVRNGDDKTSVPMLLTEFQTLMSMVYDAWAASRR